MHSSQSSIPALPRTAHREVSQTTTSAVLLGFLPAFRDPDTEEVHLSLDENGSLATVHLLEEHLPEHWVTERDTAGRIIALKDSIIAGFMRQERFFTRAELARLPWDG